MAEDWRSAWQPMIDAIGEDFGGEAVRAGADEVERSGIRRFVEPLEFDCPLHYDEAVAREHGYSGIIAPYSSVTTWTIPPMWVPGAAPVFTSAERDAQPARSPVAPASGRPTPAPPTTGYFATDIEIEYFQPVIVGDRLSSSGRRLLSVVPKETSVGRGAFLIWETEVRNQRGELVAKMRNGTYNYNPHPR
jgi:acyl dehydratase